MPTHSGSRRKTSLLAAVENGSGSTAERSPTGVNSDHLTVIAGWYPACGSVTGRLRMPPE